MKPMLQIALDNLTIEDAIASAKKVEKYIDVIEVGTILIASEGKKAIKALKEAFPNKIIVADGKIADAGKVFGKMFFENGADFTTCICALLNCQLLLKQWILQKSLAKQQGSSNRINFKFYLRTSQFLDQKQAYPKLYDTVLEIAKLVALNEDKKTLMQLTNFQIWASK